VAPGQDHLGPAVAAFDEWFDRQLEVIRGHPLADRVFTAASQVGDFSLVWHVVSGARGLGARGGAPLDALVFSALVGAESLVVNQGVKRLFRRHRPTESGDDRYAVRRPSTSSFPSGHASSAAFAASLLVARARPWAKPLWIALAGVVALSRAFVRIHHASDVIAGVAVGLALAALAKRLVPSISAPAP
jgi:membrane-associated phospholipid phosphatase